MKKRSFLRSVSCALVLSLFVTGLPVQASGTEGKSVPVQMMTDTLTEQTLQAENLLTATEAESAGAQVLCEVEELREMGTKHFRMSDGTFLAVNYGIPVHYMDADGEWQVLASPALLRALNGGAGY